jgi:hypothetical protein
MREMEDGGVALIVSNRARGEDHPLLFGQSQQFLRVNPQGQDHPKGSVASWVGPGDYVGKMPTRGLEDSIALLLASTQRIVLLVNETDVLFHHFSSSFDLL